MTFKPRNKPTFILKEKQIQRNFLVLHWEDVLESKVIIFLPLQNYFGSWTTEKTEV
jgi:hypothetical protein